MGEEGGELHLGRQRWDWEREVGIGTDEQSPSVRAWISQF
jgi:hypothetical protein